MLNPEFRLLDAEQEQFERIASLADAPGPENTWKDIVRSLDSDLIADIMNNVIDRLSTAGVHFAGEVTNCIRTVAQEKGVSTPEVRYFGWPESILQKIISRYPAPRVLLLGVLDGDGIWAGVIGGICQGGIDFLTTFRFLWNDEPELASKQSFADLSELCQVMKRKFTRPVTGLFIYRDEFIEWRDKGWTQEILQQFIANNTAALCEQ